MDEEFLKPETVNGTRWVDPKLRATSKLLRGYCIILTHMPNYADVSNKACDRAKAKGIIAKLLQYKFVWFLHFLSDILNELATYRENKYMFHVQLQNYNLQKSICKICMTTMAQV